MKKIAISQSNYIPWKGYFDLIASVDEFVLYDDVQYTRRDWRNRNLIKTPTGEKWITVPVRTKGNYDQNINQIELDGTIWTAQHLKTIRQNYARAPFFEEVISVLEPFYESNKYKTLSELNHALILTICGYLGISTRISRSSDYELCEGRNERLASICRQASATKYVSGPAARSYLDEQVFNEVGISVSWFDYSGYAEYQQLWGQFVHGVSVIDLLFNCGPNSPQFMKYVNA